MRHFIFAISIIFFLNTIVSGQTNPNTLITGKIFDKSTNQALEYATVSVTNIKTGKLITGTVADAKGAFKISGIPFGTYKVEIDFIGYETNTIDSLKLSGTKRTISLGTLYLNSSMHGLEEVNVTGEKPVIENKIDKIVYNVANDITSQGGLAIDVLKKVPQVTVDVDGNVELQGNSNIRFLINGKPSTVFGNSLADALASIPASQIKSIEAITTPGAKYDSQGTGGIINIILQDNEMQGVNGNINLSVGSRLENGSGNFNLRHKNFGFNAFISGNGGLKSQVPSSQIRTATDTTSKTISTLSQNGVSDFTRYGIRSGIGFDWNITKNDILTGSLGYNQFRNRFTGVTDQEQLIQDYANNPLSDVLTVRNSDSHFRISSLEWSLDFKKKFKKENQELDILYTSSNSDPHSDYSQTQSYVGQAIPYTGSSSLNPGTDKETSISIDYDQPVTSNFLIETGAKTTIQNLTSIDDVSVFTPANDQYIADPLQSYNLKYNMKIYAGYLSANFKLFNYLDIKSGARYEYTHVSIDFPNTSIPAYGTLVPNIVISHNFSKNQSLKLAYSKRIERPEYRDLNPFLNRSDPYNISTGNILLKPEIGNNFELGYNAEFKKGGNIYVSLIERINTHDIKQITTFYPTYMIGDSLYSNVSLTNRQNVGEEYNTGISASGSYPVTSKLNVRGNLMVMNRYSVTSLSPGNTSTGFRVRLNGNVTYELPKDLVLEAFGFYNSPSRNVQGKVPQFFIYTLAFRKLFWNKNASLGVTATNLFGKYIKQVTTITTDNSVSSNIRQIPFRSFGISLSYKFGKLKFKKKQGNEPNPIEENNPIQ